MKLKGKEKQAKRRKEKKKAAANTPKPMSFEKISKELNKLFNPSKLTTPTSITESILRFCSKISDISPFFIDVTPEPWSRQSCCDLNVAEYIRIHGGQIVCGYRIWSHPPMYIEGERHALWFKDGVYKDISFNPDGETRVLFVPDTIDKQDTLEQNKDRIRWGQDQKTKQLINFQEEAEGLRPIHKMSNEQAWNTMLTYESWQNGQRMPNLIHQPMS